jgi:hypothetical protein
MSAPATTGTPRRRPPDGPRRGAAAGLLAIAAVAVGILLVNLLHHQGSHRPTAAQGAPATSATTTRPPAPPATSAAPSSQPSSAPGPTATAAAPGAFAPVVILNDSKIQGLADAARAPVEKAGFTVDRIGGYVSTYNVPVATVFYENDLQAAAQNLQRRVPGITKIEPISGTDIKLYEPGKLILVVTRDFPTAPPG